MIRTLKTVHHNLACNRVREVILHLPANACSCVGIKHLVGRGSLALTKFHLVETRTEHESRSPS